MCKDMIMLDTYPQSNSHPEDVMIHSFGEKYIEFEVEKEWLEKTLNDLKWGTVEQYLVEYTWDDAELIYRSYEDYKSGVWELCPHCEHEVLLMANFKYQNCPNCKEKILPCAQCETMDCGNCPLQ